MGNSSEQTGNAKHARITSIDVAKGLAILAIMVGHMQFRDASGSTFLQAWLMQFHVPVFFVIAGYFLSTKRNIRTFIGHEALRLLVPYAITAAVVVVGTGLLQVIGQGSAWPATFAKVGDAAYAALYGSGSWYNLTLNGIAPIGAIWFLPALFFALIIARVCLAVPCGLFATIPLAFACIISAHGIWLPLSLQSAGAGSLLVAIGYWLRQREFMSKPLDKLMLSTSVALFIAAGIYDLKISFASLLTAGNFAFSLVIALNGSALTLMVARLIDAHVKPLARFFSFYGKSSLVVLCVHLLMLDLGVRTLLAATGLAGNLLAVVDLAVQMALVSACIPLSKKVPGLRRVFY